jgi:hypothetical protein
VAGAFNYAPADSVNSNIFRDLFSLLRIIRWLTKELQSRWFAPNARIKTITKCAVKRKNTSWKSTSSAKNAEKAPSIKKAKPKIFCGSVG